MGFKIKNSLTGEFEKLPILTLKGEKGETGGVEEYNKVDYMGNKYETLKQANDANVEYAVKTAIGEFNYLDYDGQHITALDTLAGQAKNAIIKGQTLVNLAPKKIIEYTASSDWDGFNVLVQNSKKPNEHWRTLQDLKPNTKYYISCYVETFEDVNSRHYHLNNPNQNCLFVDSMRVNGVGHYQWISITRSELTDETYLVLRCQNAYARGAIKIRDIMIIEYQEGMENWDIPYFEGMKSVQMPVLTTTGKNLINLKAGHSLSGGCTVSDEMVIITGNQDYRRYIVPLTLEAGTYSLQGECGGGSITIRPNPDGSGNQYANAHGNNTFTLGEKTTVFLALNTGSYIGDVHFKNIQLEKRDKVTSYEPYKSNILTVNEPIELRGIGDVKDELDCLTGELTQAVYEYTFTGDEAWGIAGGNAGGYSYFSCYANQLPVVFDYGNGANVPIACDKLPIIKYSDFDNGLKNVGINLTYTFRLNFSDCNSNDGATVEDLKAYLKANPTTVQYPISKSVKTVALSDHHVYSYKDVTHYDCSSAEGSLVPTLSVKVPTDVQATIAQQRETIQTLNSENERLNQIQEALKASMLDSQVQLMNLSWDTDFEVFTLRESIAPKVFSMDSKTGSNIDKFSQAKFIIENDCPDLEKLNSQIEYYFSKDVFSQEQFEELTDLISIVKGENGCEY